MQGLVTIVTGAGSGLGRSICLDAGRRGRSSSPPTSMTAMVQEVRQRYGHIDFLFNNAGHAQNGEFQDLPMDGFRKVVDVNFWGVVHGTRAVYPIMTEQGHGTIANVMSLAGLIPSGLMTAYGAAKHAATGFTLNLRSEARQYGVHVVAVCPGYLDTPMHETAENVSDYVKSHDTSYRSKTHHYPTPEKVIRHLMRGVRRNRAIVVSPRVHRPFWWL